MTLVMEDGIIDMYHRHPPQARWLHELSRPLDIMRKLGTYSVPAQFIVQAKDGRFYPLSIDTPRKVIPAGVAHARGELPFIRVGFQIDSGGFDTLEQATLWWDVCGE